MKKLRICFAGTPAFAAEHLAALLATRHDVVAVYTQPDRAAGRGNKLQASAVKQLSLEHSIPVHQPASLKGEAEQKQFQQLSPDVLVVVAYGLILPQAILDIPLFGCINVHASLLPRWRGAAPIERALLAGDTVTGVTIMRMDAGLDTGDMLACEKVRIGSNDSRVDLENKLAFVGRAALVTVLDDLENTLKNAVKQDSSQSTYATKLEKSESLIRWSFPAETIQRQIRAGIGRAPAYCFLDGQRLRILKATPVNILASEVPGTILSPNKDQIAIACCSSQLLVTAIQLPGKSAMSVGDVLNSRPDFFTPGKVLSDVETRVV